MPTDETAREITALRQDLRESQKSIADDLREDRKSVANKLQQHQEYVEGKLDKIDDKVTEISISQTELKTTIDKSIVPRLESLETVTGRIQDGATIISKGKSPKIAKAVGQGIGMGFFAVFGAWCQKHFGSNNP